MTKKKEVESLIARYRADIAALVDRKEDMIKHIEILENLIPAVLVWYMWKVFQSLEITDSQESPFPQNEIEKAKEHLTHLESVLKELQEAVDLIKDEEMRMRKRIQDLEKLSEEADEYPDDSGSALIGLPALEVPETDPLDDGTDWKQACKDLLKKVNEINDSVKKSSQKLKENESYAKRLEKEYARLEKELREKIKLLETKSVSLSSKIFDGKEQDKNLQERLESKEALPVMQEALSVVLEALEEVRSMKEIASKSRASSKERLESKEAFPVMQEALSVVLEALEEVRSMKETASKSRTPSKGGDIEPLDKVSEQDESRMPESELTNLHYTTQNSGKKGATSKGVADISGETPSKKGISTNVEGTVIASQTSVGPQVCKTLSSKKSNLPEKTKGPLKTSVGPRSVQISNKTKVPKGRIPSNTEASALKDSEIDTGMVKKKEIEALIARYKSDISALEDRKESLLRQLNVTQNLIPTVFLWYMTKVYQGIEIPYKPGITFPQAEIEGEAREKLGNLKKELIALQQAVELIEEEENIIRNRIKELEEFPTDQIGQMSPEQADDDDVPDVAIKDQSQPDDSDWKKLCEDLIKQVNELSQNLKKSLQQIRENEDYAKQLEEEYSRLEKELQEKINLLEKKASQGSEREKALLEELESLSAAMEDALEEVRSMKESLSKASTPSKRRAGMDTAEFRQRGKEMVDYMCQYMETLPQRTVVSKVSPGYLRRLVPSEPPTEPEPWTDIMADVEDKIMPGITHWQHPGFHAYFPSGNSYPSILGDMLSDIIGCIGFSWAASPACTELETIVLDWMAKALGLPHTFLSDSKGGGVIQGSASECVLVCMLAARAEALRRLQGAADITISSEHLHPEAAHLPRLVAYCSKEAHSCVEKAAIISLVQLRILEPDDDNSLRGEILRKAIEEDKAKGLVPFFVSAVIGSTGSCSFDNLQELGPVAKDHGLWLHVDAAYAGCAMVCPELRHFIQGVEFADSFNTNPNKFLLTCFDCSLLWIKERKKLIQALTVDPLYLRHEHEEEVFDYRHWGIPLSRRFRSLKLWFVIRSFGISGLQEYIRNHIHVARRFEDHVLKDKRFEVMNDVRLGLVCFRLRSEEDNLTTDLLANINHSGKLHMIPARIKGKYIIRFCVNSQQATEADIDYAWSVISDFATELLTSPDLSPRILCGIPTTPEGRKLSRQFSFTRGVSQSAFKFSTSFRSSLYDGATPIIIPDDENDTNVFDEVFESARNNVQKSQSQSSK